MCTCTAGVLLLLLAFCTSMFIGGVDRLRRRLRLLGRLLVAGLLLAGGGVN
jgi:hypothetical protein